MRDYLDDLLVCGIILAVIIPVFLALFKRKRIFVSIVGILLLLGALPATIIVGLSVGGCSVEQSPATT